MNQSAALARRRWGTLLGAGVLGLAACAHVPPGPCETPPPLHLTLAAAERLNTDTLGRPLPTLVRVLQLQSPAPLEAADFEAVWREPEQALGPALLASEELTLEPGQTVAAWYPRSGAARYLAVVGLFRQPTGSAWQAVAALPQVPPEQCRPQPAARSGAPGRADARLQVRLEDSVVRFQPAAPR